MSPIRILLALMAVALGALVAGWVLGWDPYESEPGQRPPAAPAWSPDGTRIAFFSNRTGDFELYVVGLDGSEPVQLTGIE